MDAPALKNKDLLPSDEVLHQTLGASYPAFEAWRKQLAAQQIVLEWRYYNDGKVWLCKMIAGKKNWGWLIPYAGYFRTNFFFAEKHAAAIAASEIPESAKTEFLTADSTARLRPVSIRIGGMDDLNDAMTVLRFKQRIK